jgi:hypothetical protein
MLVAVAVEGNFAASAFASIATSSVLEPFAIICWGPSYY